MKSKLCSICELPMFCYPMIHNGRHEDVWRCMNRHGIINTRGEVHTIKGKSVRKGVKDNFPVLFRNNRY